MSGSSFDQWALPPGSLVRSTNRRQVLTMGIGATAAAVLTRPGLSAAAQATPAEETTVETRVYELPGDDAYPNGIAFDPVTDLFYVGNTEDGTILRGDVESGEVEVFSEGGADGRGPVFGLELDGTGNLYVAARPAEVFVYDTVGGGLRGRFANGRDSDGRTQEIAIAPDGAAYVTDATTPVVYRISPEAVTGAATASADGGTTGAPARDLEVFVDLVGTPFAYRDGAEADGINADGIVVTPDGEYLLVVQPNTGRLYRIAVATKEVVAVDLGGATLARGNGMDLDGRTLYVVLIEDGSIVPVAMADDYASGVAGEGIVDRSLDRPTAIAVIGDGTALVANHQASPPDPPELPFVVSRLTLPPTE